MNIDSNYWDVYPEDRVVRPFSDLYNKDKSREKKSSSNVMWGLRMLTDPNKENLLYRMSRSSRLEELKENYLSDSEFNLMLKYEDDYSQCRLSYVKKRLAFYQKILEDREAYMNTLTYEEHSDKLDDMLAKSGKIWAEYLKIKKEVEIEEQVGHVQGGREESASEKGLL